MAKQPQPTIKSAGIALIILGIGIAFWGYRLSDSMGSQITQAFTGSNTDEVMIYYIGGAVSFVVGLFLSTRK